MQSVVDKKIDIYDDRGSFTVEASVVCSFIIVIVINLIILLLQAYDMCIMQEDINRNILEINDKYEEKYIESKYICDNNIEDKNKKEGEIKENNVIENNIKENDILDKDIKSSKNDIDITDVIHNIEQQDNYGIRKLLSMEIINAEYYIINDTIRVDVNYRYKKHCQTLINLIFSMNKKYSFSRVYKLVCFDKYML